jgi:nicotinamidase-related amidase
MLEIFGKQVFTELEEIVELRHTALLLIDVQRDFCSPDGMYGAMGCDLSIISPAVRNIRRVLAAARRVGVLPVYIQNMWLPKHKAVSGAWLRFMVVKRNMDPARGCTVVGTRGAEILPDVAPQPGDIVVQKWRSSAYVGTNLDMVLRSNEIKTVVCTGFVTEGCLESTARDAVFHDYYTVVLEDCVGTFDHDLHEASLKVLRTRVDVVPSQSVLDIWSAASETMRRLKPVSDAAD